MSEAAQENRPITARDVRKAIKHLTRMRERRIDLLDKYDTEEPDHRSIPYLAAERDALFVALTVLEEGRGEVFRALAERIASRPASSINFPKEYEHAHEPT